MFIVNQSVAAGHVRIWVTSDVKGANEKKF